MLVDGEGKDMDAVEERKCICNIFHIRSKNHLSVTSRINIIIIIIAVIAVIVHMRRSSLLRNGKPF